VDVVWASPDEVLVIGPQTRALGRPASADSAAVGIRFRAGVGAPLLGVPAHELVNLHVPLDSIGTRPAASLVRELAAVESAAEASTGLALAIAKRAASSAAPDPLVRDAAALLDHAGVRVEAVAQRLSVSPRRLQRRFREAVGYEPKMLQRVLRFQRLIEALEAGREAEGGLARIAAMIGYSDQSHLTRECREFSGLRPLRLESVLSALKRHGALGAFKTGRRSRAIIATANRIGTDCSPASAPKGKLPVIRLRRAS
jgi:AraC-like DNA-binding protein